MPWANVLAMAVPERVSTVGGGLWYGAKGGAVAAAHRARQGLSTLTTREPATERL